MNKRIIELAEQAGLIVDKYDMFFAKDNHNEDGVDLEKFAKMIVEDCLKILEVECEGDLDFAAWKLKNMYSREEILDEWCEDEE